MPIQEAVRSKSRWSVRFEGIAESNVEDPAPKSLIIEESDIEDTRTWNSLE